MSGKQLFWAVAVFAFVFSFFFDFAKYVIFDLLLGTLYELLSIPEQWIPKLNIAITVLIIVSLLFLTAFVVKRIQNKNV